VDDTVAGIRRAVVAIGSNLGDRAAALAFAESRLGALLDGLVISEAVETEPEGEGVEGQSLYLNAVAAGDTRLGARALLDELHAIEGDFGRVRTLPNAARTLDLDLILLGDEVIHEEGLDVPHPRFRDRFFVLGPLTEIAPGLVDPESGRSIVELLRRLMRDEDR
jgi:2-amino-4-hydroxy-6-hydroxymethyldihydropteridine diphosphokinase